MTKQIPASERAPWYRTRVFLEAVGSIPPIIAAGVAAKRLLDDATTATLGWVSVGAAVWLALAAVTKLIAASAQDKKESPETNGEGLRAAMYVLHASAAHACQIPPTEAKKYLRVTFHGVLDPTGAADTFQQLVEYIGGKGGGMNRTFPVQSGIAGMAVRTGSVYAQSRNNDDNEAYENELVEKWGFTRRGAKSVSKHCFSWMAVPILDRDGNHVLGVVYLDGTEKDLFTDAARRSAIVVACTGVANYVGERY